MAILTRSLQKERVRNDEEWTNSDESIHNLCEGQSDVAGHSYGGGFYS